jgi:hypothetical protein
MHPLVLTEQVKLGLEAEIVRSRQEAQQAAGELQALRKEVEGLVSGELLTALLQEVSCCCPSSLLCV